MLTISDRSFQSRLFVGTGKFRSSNAMIEAIKSSESELVTMALKRVEPEPAAGRYSISPCSREN